MSHIKDINDLVYSGTLVPTTNVALTNMLTYGGISLSFMFTYDGGHVFRTVVPAYLSSSSSINRSVEHLKVWKKPGDETIPGVAPAYTGKSISPNNDNQPWQTTDDSVLIGDIIKLRDLTLSYDFPGKWMQYVHARSFRVTLQGQNLFSIGLNKRHVNPENYSSNNNYSYGAASYVYLPSRVFSVGLSLGF